MLIGITGKARSGKDTAAKFIVDSGFVKYSFADPLKSACSEMFGIPLTHFYDDAIKDKINEFWGFSPRRMAQLLGTEGGRELFRDDLWIKRAQVFIDTQPCENIVIPDVRFENEAEFIRDNNGILIHIVRDGVKSVEAHKSENGVSIAESDIVVRNNGTINDLRITITGLLI